MSAPCVDNTFFARPVAQTLFLGASVASFTSSAGWGGQPSQLTVNLVEDFAPHACAGFSPPDGGAGSPGTRSSTPNVDYHQFFQNSSIDYNTCTGLGCYVDKLTGAAATTTTPLENRILPGKVYYHIVNNGIFPRWWTKPDPGFFGYATRINPDGTYNTGPNPVNRYDIIDTPVYFNMGSYIFGGFVQSWSRSTGQNGQGYSVIINSPQSLLNSCYIILDKFAGSIFSIATGDGVLDGYGTPKNWVANAGANYINGDIADGVLPNIFNVYGFLESLSFGHFGTAYTNENGMSINYILRALSVLTSTLPDSTNKLNQPESIDWKGPKLAFSPFGRIISKCMTKDNYSTDPGASNAPCNDLITGIKHWGVVSPTNTIRNGDKEKCQFMLDLREVMFVDHHLPAPTKLRFPDNIRINGPVLSIGEFINQIAEKGGFDTFVELVPTVYNEQLYHVIKVKAVPKYIQPSTNIIENNIILLNEIGANISSVTTGKEKNEAAVRTLLIGGAQQRLYQVHSYRLAYSQNNFVYNPATRTFVNYYELQNPLGAGMDVLNAASGYGYGKKRSPNWCTTRNTNLTNSITPTDLITAQHISILQEEDRMQGGFAVTDNTWNSLTETGSSPGAPPKGNYLISTKYPTSTTTGAGARWFPLYLDFICPFFGFVHDDTLQVVVNDTARNTSDQSSNLGSTNHRMIRPVWLDTWSGQLAVVLRVSELPLLNEPLNRGNLIDASIGETVFNLPISANSNTVLGVILDNLGRTTSIPSEEYFVLTESEMRAALAGFDNFLVYSLAKTYKPDLIEMVRRAYYIRTKRSLIAAGVNPANAKDIAFKETDWYWKLMGSNIAGDGLYPTEVFPDKNDGSQYIQEEALQDLKILHKFITEVAKFYGKKYMVSPDGLQYYTDTTAGKNFQTVVGQAYVFGKGAGIRYNYKPTNDGAWEEYGNIIDDSIAVGSPAWMSLSDDVGKIKPILGYNNNYTYDYVKELNCRGANSAANDAFRFNRDAHAYFSFDAWLTLYEYKRTGCNQSFVIPGLDLSSLPTSEYVVINQTIYNTPDSTMKNLWTEATAMHNGGVVPARDAWDKPVTSPRGALPKSKLYISTQVDEDYVYLDPLTKNWPKILIDSPGVFLNSVNTNHDKDTSKTVLANIAIEDVAIYLRTTSNPDMNWVAYMLNYAFPMVFDPADNPHYLGIYSVSSNSAANNVELSPKAAHPFFAGIPIRSNQYTYGPWTNYPNTRTDIFGPWTKTTIQGNKATITSRALTVLERRNASNNMINSMNVEVKEELVPWNHGSSYNMDFVALSEIELMSNYQTVMETAQLEMPGLPIWNLGGIFDKNNINSDWAYLSEQTSQAAVFTYIDEHINNPSVNISSLSIYGPVVNIPSPTLIPTRLTYKVMSSYANPKANGPSLVASGPIISNIQCSVGQGGITTTYSFRTYTRKLGLFNREAIEQVRKQAMLEQQRNKKIAGIQQQINNIQYLQRKNLIDTAASKSTFGSADLSSKLFSWSPGTVLMGQAHPHIDEPYRTPKRIVDYSQNAFPGGFQTINGSSATWEVPPGPEGAPPALTVQNSTALLKNKGRISSTVQLYERKEVEAQLKNNYGMQSVMSLDGLLSPISFYPTFKNSTFAMSLFRRSSCPMCNGTKIKKFKLAQYPANGAVRSFNLEAYCDYCASSLDQSLNAAIDTEGEDIPINAITLNPIVVPGGEFKNKNTQNYIGAHPKGIHDDLSSESSSALGGQTRKFIDRNRHCIEIVGRGSVPPNKYGYKLETSRNISIADNRDYKESDVELQAFQNKFGQSTVLRQNNQRFLGLRGPLMLHSWGYDEEGYPVPNAADEPFAFDEYGRPKRFRTIRRNGTATKYRSLAVGQMFTYNNADYVKTMNREELSFLPTGFTLDSMVTPFTQTNDPTDPGGFAAIYQGDIISKTQKFNNFRWSQKQKLNEFYLNWAERPDLWKVGPIDLHWDSNRRVWTAGGEAEEKTPPYIVTNSNDISTLNEFIGKKSKKNVPYRMIYATLEEDLIKQPDFDETFATRAFIDDIEFSKEPLVQGYRRLIYIKDKCGYCAPKGTKLLCRYNRLTGFYEPISKPTITAKGRVTGNSTCVLDGAYVQGKRSNVMPTFSVNYDNPLGFTTPNNRIGIFIFLNGRWTLSAIKN